ncbi:MAG: YybH family protein [Flammeovirgaceae bacterium]
MKVVMMLLVIGLNLSSYAQSEKEINDQVWKSFVEAFNNHLSNDFLALHSKELVRSSRESRQVLNWDQYLKQTIGGDKQDLDEKRKRDLELRFTERISNGSQAIEVGVYKTTYQFSNGKTQTYYGRFHVALRKEKGVWKILVDTDSFENNTLGEKDFLAAKPME